MDVRYSACVPIKMIARDHTRPFSTHLGTTWRTLTAGSAIRTGVEATLFVIRVGHDVDVNGGWDVRVLLKTRRMQVGDLLISKRIYASRRHVNKNIQFFNYCRPNRSYAPAFSLLARISSPDGPVGLDGSLSPVNSAGEIRFGEPCMPSLDEGVAELPRNGGITMSLVTAE